MAIKKLKLASLFSVYIYNFYLDVQMQGFSINCYKYITLIEYLEAFIVYWWESTGFSSTAKDQSS